MKLRHVLVGLAVPMLGLVASCVVHNQDNVHCDYLEHRCRTVCDQYCDSYGCYPDCHDECWDECALSPPQASAPPKTSAIDAAAPDASPPTTNGTGVLCSSCNSNADCVKGSLCIVAGGTRADAGDAGGTQGFCGSACQSTNDCPQSFACVQIGSARQCLPSANGCQ